MQLFHGTNGDNILSIMSGGYIKPNIKNEIFFGRNIGSFPWRDLYMHGGDVMRKASFVVLVDVEIPAEFQKQFMSTQGVQRTLKVISPVPLKAKVLELFARRRGEEGFEEEHHKGELDIKWHLQNKNAVSLKP